MANSFEQKKVAFDSILKLIPSHYRTNGTVILFGSMARGDAKTSSDIDIAIACDEYMTSINIKEQNINITCYTNRKLLQMSREGSLFIKHLFMEGIILEGEENLLVQLRNSFNFSNDFTHYKNELKFATKLLDVDKSEYLSNWKKYNNLSLYLYRSFLYIQSQLLGINSFSIDRIAESLQDKSVLDTFKLKYETTANFQGFKNVKSKIETDNGFSIHNEFETFDALLVNSLEIGELTSWLGIRLKSEDETIFKYD